MNTPLTGTLEVCRVVWGMNTSTYLPAIQWHALMYADLHVLRAASCTPTVAMQVLTFRYLHWWALSSTIEHTYSLAHVAAV